MFFEGSATTGMIRSNLDAFFKAKKQGATLEDALTYMTNTRYSLFFKKKRKEFEALITMFFAIRYRTVDSKAEAQYEERNIGYPISLYTLAKVHRSFSFDFVANNTIQSNLSESQANEVLILMAGISLMHICEGDSLDIEIPEDFLKEFFNAILTEYIKRI